MIDARLAGNPKLERTAQRLLDGLPDDRESRTPDASSFSADDSLIRTAIDEREKREEEEEQP